MDLYALLPGLAAIIDHLFEILVVVLLIFVNLLLLSLSDKAKRISDGMDSANRDLFRMQLNLEAIVRDRPVG
jgi:hypothetical protein